MPVTHTVHGPVNADRFRPLWQELAGELRAPKDLGQPVVDIETFRTGLKRVTVFWDRFDGLTYAARSTVIQRAYEEVFGLEDAKSVAFTVGYTLPEAADAGLLPFQLSPLLRKTDPTGWDALCRSVMTDLGASVVYGPNRPLLRFRSLAEAEAARAEVIRRAPETADVWNISREFAPGEGP